ncbi:MAG: FAD-dependent oxidoreductase [Promethearchaeota archaeon]
MFDVIVIGAGTSGATFANNVSSFAKTLLIEAQDYDKEIPKRTNIFAEHNKPFIEDKFWYDNSIFPKSFLQLNYKSEKYDGLLNSKEFGAPLGKISHTEIFIQKLLESFENRGGTAHYNERVTKVNKHNDYIEIINNKDESYKTKLLVLATGSRGFKLQQSLGFDIPESYMGVYTNIWAEEELLKENFNFQYMFHLNPNISPNGPFFFNVGKGRISTGYLGNRESHSELIDKLDRILHNYQKIQKYIQGLKWNKSDFISGAISKHPIKTFTRDRVIILGEAAGLVTSYFYEGILCGLASAKVASDLIRPLIEQNSNFTKAELVKYDREVARILLKGYFRNGDACEYLFYSGGSYVKSLWNEYTNLLLTNKTVRKYVYEAHTIQDLSKYDTDKDRYVGECLFSALPTLSKIALSPRFFKAMLK